MSITLEGYNVSFDRLKIEKEYKHPIIYDKFPIKANNSTVIHVSEPKIPFAFLIMVACGINAKKIHISTQILSKI